MWRPATQLKSVAILGDDVPLTNKMLQLFTNPVSQPSGVQLATQRKGDSFQRLAFSFHTLQIDACIPF
jgi:hypothetical protein